MGRLRLDKPHQLSACMPVRLGGLHRKLPHLHMHIFTCTMCVPTCTYMHMRVRLGGLHRTLPHHLDLAQHLAGRRSHFDGHPILPRLAFGFPTEDNVLERDHHSERPHLHMHMH